MLLLYIGCQLLPSVRVDLELWGSCKTGMKTIGDSPQILTLTGEFTSLQRALSGLEYGFGFELSIVMHSNRSCPVHIEIG